LEEFEEQADRKRDELRQRISDAEARYNTRCDQMDELHFEAGELAAASTGTGNARRAGDEACGMVASELQALAETLGDDSDTKGKINIILSKLATATAGSGPQRYDIGDADGAHGGGGAGDAQLGGEEDATVSWSADASGRWNRRGASAHRDANSVPRDDGWQWPRKPVRQVGNRTRADGNGGTSPAGAASSGGSAARGGGDLKPAGGESEARGGRPEGAGPPSAPSANDRSGGQGRKRGSDEENDEPPKSLRAEDDTQGTSVELGGDDARRALKLQQEQAVAIWAARNAQSIFGDDVSRGIAGQLFAHKVQLVEARAREVGVEPRADGKSLVDLDPEAFMAWVHDVLEPAEKAAAQEAKDL
jgi:hypothetical protein